MREKSPWQRLGEWRLLPFPSSQLKGHFQGPYYARAWAKGAQGRAGVETMGNNLSPTLKASYSAEHHMASHTADLAMESCMQQALNGCLLN